MHVHVVDAMEEFNSIHFSLSLASSPFSRLLSVWYVAYIHRLMLCKPFYYQVGKLFSSKIQLNLMLEQTRRGDIEI